MGYFYLLTTVGSFIMKVDYRCLFNSLISLAYLIRKPVAGLYGSSSVTFEALGDGLYSGCADLHLWPVCRVSLFTSTPAYVTFNLFHSRVLLGGRRYAL